MKLFFFKVTTLPAHDVRTTLFGRCFDVKILQQRCNDVVPASCAGWVYDNLSCRVITTVFRCMGKLWTNEQGNQTITKQTNKQCSFILLIHGTANSNLSPFQLLFLYLLSIIFIALLFKYLVMVFHCSFCFWFVVYTPCMSAFFLYDVLYVLSQHPS